MWLALAGAAIAIPTIVPASVFGLDAPSGRITVGCVGIGGQGSGNMNGLKGNKASQVVAVTDVDFAQRESTRGKVGLSSESSYVDYRDLL